MYWVLDTTRIEDTWDIAEVKKKEKNDLKKCGPGVKSFFAYILLVLLVVCRSFLFVLYIICIIELLQSDIDLWCL